MTCIPGRDDRARAEQLAAVLGEVPGTTAARAVVLTGPPGIGKTTAMRTLATGLGGTAARVRRAAATPDDRVRPFGLAAALVGLTPAYPPPQDYVERLTDQVEKQCDDGPLVLLADDLHDSDPDSLRVLDALVGATADLPVRLVLARRPLPMRPALAALAARPDVHAIELAGIGELEVDAMVRARLGLDPGTALRALLSAAGGNPAHIEALLDDLEHRGRVVADHRVGAVELEGAGPGDGPDRSDPAPPAPPDRTVDDPDGVRAVLEVATTALRTAPAHAADLLASVTGRGTETDRNAVALAHARALAGAGQTAEAARVARERLTVTTDDAARASLLRVVLHTTLSTADTAGVLATLRNARTHSVGPGIRPALERVEHFTTVMAGRETLDDEPTGPSTVARALALYARGHPAQALAVLDHDAPGDRGPDDADGWTDLTSDTIWPALFALHADGPAAARDRSVSARREAQERGRAWLTPGLLFVAGNIDAHVGRWDDALAQIGAGLEAAAASGFGWVSAAFGLAAALRVRRGELDVAGTDLTRWRARGLPEQLGLPQIDLAEMLLHEAQGRGDLAGTLASRSWARALGGGRSLWALLAGADTARVARWVRDDALLARVVADTRRVPLEEVPTLAPVVDLVVAVADGDADRAAAAATAFAARGNVLGELGSWEEAAVGAAAAGDRARAREHAARCSAIAEGLGARTVERRLAGRLRALDVRTGPPRSAGRPATGWASLTPTELEVAEFVGQGLTSPQIATRMFLSPRTVQTHVSHALAKLDLHTRSELAATVIRHQR